MKIAVPVAAFHPGNVGEYVGRALLKLGHKVQILDFEALTQSLSQPVSQGGHDLYFCVDSSSGINFPKLANAGLDLSRVAMWYIDYRHNKDRQERVPPDFIGAECLQDNGGWIFQAQKEDFVECQSTGITNSSWLPLAADVDIWSDEPAIEKIFDIGFVGNIWDQRRGLVLKALHDDSDIKFAFKGNGEAWKENGAALLRSCRIGFNINTYAGENRSYDINMRFFETLSCGVPLITDEVSGIGDFFSERPAFIKTFSEISEILSLVKLGSEDSEFLNSGTAGRDWVIKNATYLHRVKEALNVLDRFYGGK